MQEMMEIYGPNRINKKSNRIDRFGSVIKSNRFGSILQKLAKTEPNQPMHTPSWMIVLREL